MIEMIEMTFFKFRENNKSLSGESIIPIVDKIIAMELLELCKDEYAKELNGDIFLEVPAYIDELEISDKLKDILDQYKNCVICIPGDKETIR